MALLIAVVVAAFAYDVRTKGIFACSAGGYSAGRYLAYCNSLSYGDYDHGSVWFGLEPGVREAAHNADVLFLGSSRTEFGLSTAATRRWFAAQHASFYLLGFSHSENVSFVGPLLATLSPQARVYVINTDRFFEVDESEPAAEILHDGDAASHYRRKRLWQGPHRVLCSAVEVLCANGLGFFRNVDDGTWVFAGANTALTTGGIADSPAPDAQLVAARAETAKRFVAALPASRGCVFFTVVPSGATPRAQAAAIAAAAGIELFAPRGDELRTFDESHLDAASAERWSAEFFAAAGDSIAACLGTTGREPQSPPAADLDHPATPYGQQ